MAQEEKKDETAENQADASTEATEASEDAGKATKGAAKAEGRDQVIIKTVDMDKPETITVPLGDHIERKLGKLTQDADFVRAIREDDAAPIPGEDGRANIEIGLAIIESGRTGEVVKLPMA